METNDNAMKKIPKNSSEHFICSTLFLGPLSNFPQVFETECFLQFHSRLDFHRHFYRDVIRERRLQNGRAGDERKFSRRLQIDGAKDGLKFLRHPRMVGQKMRKYYCDN